MLNQEEILYGTKLYEYQERKQAENENVLEKFKDFDITKLTIEENESKEEPMKGSEAQIFLENMKSDKCSGADCFTA